ncbi:unnamed protein product [marine sediment metagenome]|uniref:PIN domain-containing protein n=1 Tax=marine sediment metagenome TaxID=412755 RepID=X0T3S7_9ZZZZ
MMKKVVLDASVALKWFLEEKDTDIAERILKQVKKRKLTFVFLRFFILK